MKTLYLRNVPDDVTAALATVRHPAGDGARRRERRTTMSDRQREVSEVTNLETPEDGVQGDVDRLGDEDR